MAASICNEPTTIDKDGAMEQAVLASQRALQQLVDWA
jgi:hypothetical protein